MESRENLGSTPRLSRQKDKMAVFTPARIGLVGLLLTPKQRDAAHGEYP